MSGDFTHHHILQPGQRVAVFPDDAASGATIGYYGTVVHAEAESVRRSPRCPNAWRYQIATIAGLMNVDGCNVLPLGNIAQPFLRRGFWPEYELCFQTPISADNEEIQGF